VLERFDMIRARAEEMASRAERMFGPARQESPPPAEPGPRGSG
jgi:hypothetical protein